ILDMVSGDYFMKNLRSLAFDGRLVIIAFLNGSKSPDFDANALMRRSLTVTGSTLRPRSVEDKAAIAASLREKVWPLFESGKLKLSIFKTFKLDEVVAAHELMESSRHIGKIMLEV